MDTYDIIQLQITVAQSMCNQIRQLRAAGRTTDATLLLESLQEAAREHAPLHASFHCNLCQYHFRAA